MIEFEERRPWSPTRHLLLIGPGGAGKSSVGSVLGPLLGRPVIDLDAVFLQQIGDIGAFIRAAGYEEYKSRNAALAADLISRATSRMLLITSSGFLTPDNPPSALKNNLRLVASGYAICLLPSRDLEIAVRVIVDRQLKRPFARDRNREEAVVRERYPVYARLGDLIVFSSAPADAIGRALAHRLAAQE